MLIIYLDYLLRHHRNMSIFTMLCSDDLQFIQKTKKKHADCHVALDGDTSVHPNELQTFHIASIPTADILRTQRAPCQCLRRTSNTVCSLHAMLCYAMLCLCKLEEGSGKSPLTSTSVFCVCVDFIFFPLPSLIRFSESLRTKGDKGGGG